MQEGSDFWGYNPSVGNLSYSPSSPRKPSGNLARRQIWAWKRVINNKDMPIFNLLSLVLVLVPRSVKLSFKLTCLNFNILRRSAPSLRDEHLQKRDEAIINHQQTQISKIDSISLRTEKTKNSRKKAMILRRLVKTLNNRSNRTKVESTNSGRTEHNRDWRFLL
jgi:hypothetical protein